MTAPKRRALWPLFSRVAQSSHRQLHVEQLLHRHLYIEQSLYRHLRHPPSVRALLNRLPGAEHRTYCPLGDGGFVSTKIAIVTGANTGIGEVTARELAREGMRVYLACRSEEKALAAIDRIRGAVPNADAEFLPLDLASLESVRDASSRFLAAEDRLDLLINNAGLAGPRGLTADGFELTFGVNHLGHFLLTNLLLDRIVASGPARIINVASRAHYRAMRLAWDAYREPTKSATGFREYEQSKLANVLHAAELDRRLRDTDVTTYSLHPGVVASDIWSRSPGGKVVDLFRSFIMISVDEGAKTTLHCALDDAAGERSGLYWNECRPRKPSRLARDEALAKELWERSERWIDEALT